jgi:hypothetical protein
MRASVTKKMEFSLSETNYWYSGQSANNNIKTLFYEDINSKAFTFR